VPDLYGLLRPFFFSLEPERAHRLTLALLALRPARHRTRGAPGVDLWGLRFPNRVGIAAGFDKNAEAVEGLFALGFGFVEVGSVTPKPQAGNPRPRLFRLRKDEAVINRMGFNNDGAEVVARRLERLRRQRLPGPLGVNLGKNKDQPDPVADYVTGARLLGPFADYVVVNVSSPNTPGLRALQSRAVLADLLAAVQAALPAPAPPLLVKIAPDLTEEDEADVVEVARSLPLAGIIAGNTTLSRPPTLASRDRGEAGGLSGRPLYDLSTAQLRRLSGLAEGDVALVGTGGIFSGADAVGKLAAGAELVQLYTGLVYRGPALVGEIVEATAGVSRAPRPATA